MSLQRDLELRIQPFSPSAGPGLQITVVGGAVKLEGKIANQYDHDALIEIVKSGAGTNRIVDRLTVTKPVAKSGMTTQDTKERYGAWLAAHHPQ
ncbi:MAG: BON domain-containing protein [Acidobacteriota bacterium]|nr:BON domain-containing protein [Acidobacteriota bacterium]